MKATMIATAAILGVLVSASCFAAAPAGAPAGTTGLCKDGSYYSNTEKRGACRGHKGVQEWYGTPAAAAPAATPSAPAAVTPAAPKAAPAKPAAMSAPTTPARTATGGPGMVWANLDSMVYHCPNSRWYGKTKMGAYMTQAEATAKGLRADHGKACQ